MNMHVLNLASSFGIFMLGLSLRGIFIYFHIWGTPLGTILGIFMIALAIILKVKYVDMLYFNRYR